jgi:hypothetical protein
MTNHDEVPAVVEVEVVEAGDGDGVLESPPDASGRPEPADARRRHRGEQLVDRLAHRDLTSAAGLRALELEHAAEQVDPLPGQPEDQRPLSSPMPVPATRPALPPGGPRLRGRRCRWPADASSLSAAAGRASM